MEIERHLFCIFNLFNVLNFKTYESWGVMLHKPILKRKKELRESKMAWLNQRFNQFSLGSSVLSFCMMYCLMFCATCWWEIWSVCSLCMRDLPHTYSCTCLFNQRKTKKETNKGSTDLSSGEPKSFYYYYFIYLFLIFLFLF